MRTCTLIISHISSNIWFFYETVSRHHTALFIWIRFFFDFFQASSIETSYQEARFELEDCEWDVSKAAEKIKNLRSSSDDAVSTAQHMLILEQSVANFSFLSRSTTRKYVTHSTVEDNAIVFEAKKSLIELHGRLKQSQIRASACERRWKHIVLRCERAEVSKDK